MLYHHTHSRLKSNDLHHDLLVTSEFFYSMCLQLLKKLHNAPGLSDLKLLGLYQRQEIEQLGSSLCSCYIFL